MRQIVPFSLASCLFIASPPLFAAGQATEDGVHCRIDQTTFVGDPGITRIDYVVPPGGKPPRFRILSGHEDDAIGTISVELKAHVPITLGSVLLSQEPTWKSVAKLPKQQDSAITSGAFVFTHFDPGGDSYAAGTAQFQTADGHRGECSFRLKMEVVDLGHLLR